MPIRSARIGISTAWSPLQSTSNQRANGDAGPSRSTDHSARLSRTGIGTDMWLGTTSTIADIPPAASAEASRWNPSRPPISALIRVWSTTS